MRTPEEIAKTLFKDLWDHWLFQSSDIPDGNRQEFIDGLAQAISAERARLDVAVEALKFYASPWDNHFGTGGMLTRHQITKILDDSCTTAIAALKKIEGGK